MLYTTVPLVGLEQTFIRPIVTTVIRDLRELIPLMNKLEVKPGSEGVYTMRTTMSENGEHVTTGEPHETTLEVNVEEDFLERDISPTFISQRNELPVLEDERLGLEIKPVRAGIELKLNISIKSTSRSKLMSLYNTMRLRLVQGMTRVNHRVTFQYLIPKNIGLLLTEIHEKREAIAGYGDSFQDYIFKKSDGRLRWVTDVAGKNIDLAVKETWNRFHGRFDDVPLPSKPSYEEGDGLWTMEFTYVLDLDKPTHIHVKYPLMVHNQLLDPKFVLPKGFTLEKDMYKQNRMLFDMALRDFELQHENHYANLWSYFRVPLYDRWQPPNRLPGMAPLWTALCQLTEDDRRSLLNLRELGDIEVDEDLLNWISVSETQYVIKGFGSLIFIGLYENDILRDAETITLDTDLNLIATEDLDLRKTYRVVMYLMTDPTLVADRSWYSIREPQWETVRNKLEYAIQKKLTSNPGTSDRSYVRQRFLDKDRIHHWSNGYGPNYDFEDSKNSINWDIRSFSMYTVMTSNLVALRAE